MVDRYFTYRYLGFMISSLLVTLCLDLLPLPGAVIWFRPEWTLLFLLYSLFMIPNGIGLFFIFFIGLFLDLMHGILLGESAFALLGVAYLLSRFRVRIAAYSMLQQTLVMGSFVFAERIIVFVIQTIIDQRPYGLIYWLPVIISTVLWPWMFMMLRTYQQKWFNSDFLLE